MFLEVLKKFLENVLKIQRHKKIIELIEYTNISWSDFGQKRSNYGQIFGKIGQIVSQIFANFSQILIISTLKELIPPFSSVFTL